MSDAVDDGEQTGTSIISDDLYHDHVDDTALQKNPTNSVTVTLLTTTAKQPPQQRIVMVIPVQALEQREAEMNQTAKILGIPPERWSDSLLYNEWKRRSSKTSESPALKSSDVKITLYPDRDDSNTLAYCQQGKCWTTTCCAPSLERMIQSYYVTGTLAIPRTVRGYDVLAAVEYFRILYQPDQCHFADYAAYKRVQQWSRYLCHRATLAAWVVQQLQLLLPQQQQRQQQDKKKNKLFCFGTTSFTDEESSSMEFGTQPLLPLGDTTVAAAGPSSSPKSMAKIAFKLFNSPDDATTTATLQQQQQADANDENTLPGPEESTAIEMRDDFCAYLHFSILAAAAENVDDQQCTVVVKFSVKPVTITVHGNHSDSADVAAANSSQQRLKVVNRAVLMVDLQQATPTITTTTEASASATTARQESLQMAKQARIKSELSAPVDELVEEELAKGRLEEILHQVEARSVTFNVPGSDNKKKVTTIKASRRPPSLIAPETPSSYVNLSDQIKTVGTPSTESEHSRRKQLNSFNAPHDELNASLDTTTRTSIGEFPPKKKRKPKPVFELPDKLLSVDPLSRVNPVTAPPAPIALVRAGTYDNNTVTSALTGPFYIDDNGNLRDVFEHQGRGPDSDTDGDYEDDDDTRAQARRHEWIQTALLNRGIGERMESLLKEEGDEAPSLTANFDPWDWLTGLGVCEFSRSVMKSVEQYANSVGGVVDLPSNVDQKQAAEATATRNTAGVRVTPSASPSEVVGTRSPVNVKSILSDESGTTEEFLAVQPVTLSLDNRHVRSPSTTVKDHLRVVQAIKKDEQSREDLAYDHVDRITVLPDQQDNREDSSRSQSSKESPRGVQRFDAAVSVPPDSSKESPRGVQRFDAAVSARTDKSVPSTRSSSKAVEAAGEDNRGEPSKGAPVAAQAEVATPKKGRGIKALFRRRKADM